MKEEEEKEQGKCYENDVEMKGDDCAASECFTLTPSPRLTNEHSNGPLRQLGWVLALCGRFLPNGAGALGVEFASSVSIG